MSYLFQFVGTGLICSLCMCMGIMFAWPSSTLRLFQSANTTLNRPMTAGEIDLFGSLSSFGALVGTPVAGWWLDKIGRKNSAIVGGALGVIAWVMIAVWSRVEWILAAIFISGLSGSVFLVVPVFVGEICEESIRGAMCSGSMLFYGVGMLISYLVGGCLEYKTMVYVNLFLTTVMTLSLFYLRESPTYLMARQKEKEAAASIAFYRRLKTDSKEVAEEISGIKRSLNPELDDTPEEEKQLKPDFQNRDKLSLWQFLKKSSSTRSAIYLTMILVTASTFQGMVVVQVYAEPLIAAAVPSMPPTLGCVMIAVVGVVAGIIAAFLTEWAGRRPLMIYSSVATAVSCLLLGFQIHLHWGPHWLIAVNLYVFSSLYSFGAATVPYVLLAEVFLPEVKGSVTMLVVEWVWLCNGIILYIFNPVLNAIGLGPVFYLFAGVGVFTAIYSIIYLPETKGLTTDAIQKLLSKKKKKRTNGDH